jgi:CheY-like chemotaxis protein
VQLFAIRNALVVDADSGLKKLLSEIFEPGLWAIKHVTTNRAALRATKRKAFELIITSEKTSGIEDVELLRKIRGERPHIRLIILTDTNIPADALASMQAHAFSFFSKPYLPEQLRSMIQLAIDSCWDDGIELLSSTPEWIRLPEWIKLKVNCQVRAADRLLQFMKEISDLPYGEREGVGMAFREILLNAMEHGGGFNPENYVEVECSSPSYGFLSYLRSRTGIHT